MTRLSVIVPMYDVERYVGEALDSIRAQTFDDFEVVLVDDGSSDSTVAIARRVCERDSRFRLLERPNSGPGGARNAGLENTTGELLVFVDSDDVLRPSMFADLVAAIDRAPDIDVVTTSAERLAGVTLPPSAIHEISHPFAETSTTMADSPWLVFDTLPWNKLFRRAYFDEVVGRWPAHQIYEDLVPMTTALVRARAIGVLPTRHYLWRLRSDGTSITQQRAGVESDLVQIEQTRATWRVVHRYGTPEVLDWFAWKTHAFDFVWMVRKFAILGRTDGRRLADALAAAIREIGTEVTGALPADLRRCFDAVLDGDLARLRRLTALHRTTLLPDRRHLDRARREPALDARLVSSRSTGRTRTLIVSTPAEAGEPELELSATPPWIDDAPASTLGPRTVTRRGRRLRATFDIEVADLAGAGGEATFVLARAGSSSGEPLRSARDRLAPSIRARQDDCPVRLGFEDTRPVLFGPAVAPFVDMVRADGDRLVLAGERRPEDDPDEARITDASGAFDERVGLAITGSRFELVLPLSTLHTSTELFLAFINSNSSGLPTPVFVTRDTLGSAGTRGPIRTFTGPRGQLGFCCNSNDLRTLLGSIMRRIRAIS